MSDLKPVSADDPAFHLALGHTFARNWSALPPSARLGLLSRPRRLALIAEARKEIMAPPNALEAASHRIRVGRAIARSQRSVLPLLLSVPELGWAYVRSRQDARRVRRAMDIDIGLPNDPLLLPGASAACLRARREWLVHLPGRINALAATNPRRPRSPLLYLSGMEDRPVPSGYGRRTAAIVNALRHAGITTELNHLHFGSAAPPPGDIPLVIDLADTIEDGVSRAVDALVRRAEVLGSQTICSGSNWLAGLIGLSASRRLGLPFIYDVRGLWAMTRAVTQVGYANRLAYRAQLEAEAALMRAADRTIFISAALRNWAVARGTDPTRCRVVPNMASQAFLDPFHIKMTAGQQSSDAPSPAVEALRATDGHWVIGHAGSLTAYEGLDTLIDMVAIGYANGRAGDGLPLAGRPLTLWIAGDGPMAPQLRAKVAALPNPSAVRLLGPQPVSVVRELVARTDVMVFPRMAAPLFQLVPALKPVEAMAAGRAVLASDLLPHKELARGELAGEEGKACLRLVSSTEAQDWRDALEAMLSDPDMQSGALGRRARAAVANSRAPETAIRPFVDLFQT